MSPFELKIIVPRTLESSDGAFSTTRDTPVTFDASLGALATVWDIEMKPGYKLQKNPPLTAISRSDDRESVRTFSMMVR